MNSSCVTNGPMCGFGAEEPAVGPLAPEPVDMDTAHYMALVDKYTELRPDGVRYYKPEYNEVLNIALKYYKATAAPPLPLVDNPEAVQVATLVPMTQAEMAEVDAGSDVGRALEAGNAASWSKSQRRKGWLPSGLELPEPNVVLASISVMHPDAPQDKALFACEPKDVIPIIAMMYNGAAVVEADGMLGKLAGLGIVGGGLLMVVGAAFYYGFKTKRFKI